MKRAISLILVLMLSLAMVAVAESAASPTDVALIPAAADVKIATEPSVNLFVDAAEEAQTEAAAQLAKLEAEGKEAFFGDAAAEIDAATNGNLVALIPMGLDGYEESMGDVTVTLEVPAAEALTAGQKVAVAVGTPNGIEDGATVYEWAVFEGIADGNGAVEVTIDAATMGKIAADGALFAIYA